MIEIPQPLGKKAPGVGNIEFFERVANVLWMVKCTSEEKGGRQSSAIHQMN